MAPERMPSDLVMVELLDRVLDKGIVIDATVRFGAAGIALFDIKANWVVASLKTSLEHAARPALLRSDQLRMVQMMPSAPLVKPESR
jgi:hypothetical protein